jgi:hypothetical protein
MYQSDNKRVQEIVNLIQQDGCIIEGKKITLDELPQLCQDLNDSDLKEITNLIESIMGELEELYSDRQYLNNQIKPLEAATKKLLKVVRCRSSTDGIKPVKAAKEKPSQLI